MTRKRRHPHTFWQHPAVIVGGVVLAVAAISGAYLVTRQEPVVGVADNAAVRSSVSAELSSMSAASAAAISARTAVFIGDSYTASTGASTGHGFTSLVAKSQTWIEQNVGRGGTGYFTAVSAPVTAGKACGKTYCPNYGEMIAAAQKVHPGIVVVSGGRNDAAVPAAQEATAVHNFYVALRKALPAARIVTTSPLWDTKEPPASIAVMAGEIRTAVQSVHGTYLDIGQPLAGQPAWVISDGIHPNDQGHAAIAAAIEKALL